MQKSAPFGPVSPFGPTWPHLAVFGPIWPRLTPFDPIWPSLTLFVTIWHHFALFGPALPHLALLGHSSILISRYFKVPIRQGAPALKYSSCLGRGVQSYFRVHPRERAHIA